MVAGIPLSLDLTQIFNIEVSLFSRSKNFKDFLKAALVKDPKKRPSATQLLKHPFLKGPTQTLRKTKHVLAELIEKMVKQDGEEAEGEDDDGSSEEDAPVVEKLKIDDGGGTYIPCSSSTFLVHTQTCLSLFFFSFLFLFFFLFFFFFFFI